MVVLLGGGISLSLGLAFGVLRVTVNAMSAAAVSTTSRPSAPQAVSLHSAEAAT
jgi:hypothetical protein